MKFPHATPLLLATVLAFAGCQAFQQNAGRRGGFVPPADSTELASEEAATQEPPAVAPAPVEETPPPAPPKVGNYESAKPVPGKPGFVTLPSSPASGYIDVKGFAPGDLAMDPVTKKIFVVP